MEIKDMPSNSQTVRDRVATDEPKMTGSRIKKDIPKPKLSEGPVAKKSGIGTKIFDTFLQGRNLKDVVGYTFNNVLLPSIVDGVVNTLKGTIDGFFYGDAKPHNTTSYSSNRTNYGALSRGYTSSQRTQQTGGVVYSGGNGRTDYAGTSRRRGYEMITITNRRDAESILDYLITCVRQYDCVSVADYYDAFEGKINVQARYTDNDWGWFDLSDVGIRHVPGGWTIDLPDPVKLA